MKQLLYILFAAVLLSACQVIPEDERYIPIEAQDPVSRALITECTGFRCVNCPNAAAEAHSLLETYPDNLVVVEIHPSVNAFCQTTIPANDFTSPASDSVYQWLGGSSTTAFPTGVVNLTSGFLDYMMWNASVRSAICREKAGHLALSVRHTADRSLSIDYQAVASSANSAASANLRLMLWLVEDSIVAPQMMPDGSGNTEYVHNHVLRSSVFPEVSGIALSLPTATPDSISATIDYVVPDSLHGQAIRLEHCSIVGVLVNPVTREVQDVEQQKVR